MKPSKLITTVMRGNLRYRYVDATAGNDSNDGKSPATAWQTIAKVNAASLLSGDRVLFKRGETWAGTTLTIPTDGLILADYGSGSLPVIDGQDAVDCINGNGKNNLRLENLECTQGLDFGITLGNTSHDVTIVNCVCHDSGNDQLNIMNGCYNLNISGGSFYNGYNRAGVGGLIAGIEIADGCHDIVVDGVSCYGQTATPNAGVGITIHSHAGASQTPYNITIQNSTIYDNEDRQINISKDWVGAETDRNIVISNCLIYGSAESIRVTGTSGPIIGLRLYRNRFNSTVTCAFFTNAVNLEAYNNVFYSSNTTNSPTVQINGASSSGNKLKNNIFAGATDGVYMISILAGTGVTGNDINYNNFKHAGALNRWSYLGTGQNFANWKTNSGMDANSVQGDPLFTNPATNDFTIGALSPAIDKGTVIAGVTDGYLGATPDCGYAEKA